MPTPKHQVISTSIALDNKHLWRDYPWLRHTARRYRLEPQELGEGAFATAYIAQPINESGIVCKGALKLVVKIPKISRERRLEDEIEDRINFIRRKSQKEFSHISKRLLGSSHANPIIDLAEYPVGDFMLPVTIQPFLDSASNLDQWLYDRKLRTEPAMRGGDRKLMGDWYGIIERRQWVKVALSIAFAIQDLHRRRVTHADIHPGNVFITAIGNPTAVLIDFGESFVAMPGRNSRKRNPNPYLAPERSRERSHLNERVDIYSFGVLLLYLATGLEKGFTLSEPEYRPGRHRREIYEQIVKRNPGLIADEPRILDLIGRSTARDPVDRPRMTDIVSELLAIDEYGATISKSITPSINSTLANLRQKVTKAANGNHSPVLLKLIEREIAELSNTIDGLQTEMVELSGTRDHLLRALLCVFDCLRKGDSWTAATTLALWQHNALGFDGSYLSASILALKRGVSIRRTFVVSIEELGFEFSTHLSNALAEEKHPILQKLALLFKKAIGKYAEAKSNPNYTYPKQLFVSTHQERFIALLILMEHTIENWKLGPCIHSDQKVDVEASAGLFLGITPVGTLDQLGAIREDNPAALAHMASEPDEARRWLLIMSEARGRQEEDRDGIERPHLLAVRVFKSVQGTTPRERIECLNRLFNDSSANVAAVLGPLLTLARRAGTLSS